MEADFPVLRYRILDKELYDNYHRVRYSHFGDAGIDLRAKTDVSIRPSDCFFVKLGIAIELPDGYFGMLCPRSGPATLGLGFSDSVRIIDNDYRGELAVECINFSRDIYHINRGDRIAQLVIVPYVRCELEQIGAPGRATIFWKHGRIEGRNNGR